MGKPESQCMPRQDKNTPSTAWAVGRMVTTGRGMTLWLQTMTRPFHGSAHSKLLVLGVYFIFACHCVCETFCL